VERHAAGANSKGQLDPPSEPQKVEFASAGRTLLLLKLLMEGHFAPMQDLIRTQPNRENSINLVASLMHLFIRQAGSNQFLLQMGDADVLLLTQTLLTLAEATQGPCWKTQDFLSSEASFFNALDKVMACPFHPNVDRQARLECRQAAISVLAATLEARVDKAIQTAISEEIMPLSLDMFRGSMCATYEAAATAPLTGAGLDKETRLARMEVALVALVDLGMVYDNMQVHVAR
jgi:hypothetical protein